MQKKCGKCGQIKAENEFNRDKSKIDGLHSLCKICQMEYRQRPEVQKHRREYMREYSQQPERKKHMREYRRERQREYNQRPEVKAHKLKYQREYRRKLKIEETELNLRIAKLKGEN